MGRLVLYFVLYFASVPPKKGKREESEHADLYSFV